MIDSLFARDILCSDRRAKLQWGKNRDSGKKW